MAKQQAAQYQLPIVAVIHSGETIQTVNLRYLHFELKVGRDYSTWVKDRIDRYGFVEGQDYVVTSETGGNPDPQNGGTMISRTYAGAKVAIEYHGSIDMAKELAMLENNEIGRQVRRYFIEAEKRLKEIKKPQMPYFLRRMVANMENVPPGHFSILNELAATLVGPMEAMGYTLPEHLWPDISEGLMFCAWLRKEKGIDTKKLPTYRHVFDDGKRDPVQAKAYPNELLADVRYHILYEWIPKKAAEYFSKRDPAALAYLPRLLTPKAA